MPPPVPPADLGLRTPATEAGRLLLEGRLVHVRRLEDALRAGPAPEAVHDLRVAIRRLRAALDLFGKNHPAAERLSLEARGLQRALGAVRDLQLRRAWLERLRETDAPSAAGASTWLDSLTTMEAAAETVLEEALRRWHRASTGASAEELIPALSGRYGDPDRRRPLRRGLKRLERRVEAIDSDVSPAAAHEARIAAKKAKYVAELFAPAAPDLLEPVRQAMSTLQTLGGELHDVDVRIEELARRMAADPGEATRLAPVGPVLADERAELAGRLRALVERWRNQALLRKLRRFIR